MSLNGSTATRVTAGGATTVDELRIQTMSAATSKHERRRGGEERHAKTKAAASRVEAGTVTGAGTAAGRSSDSRRPCSSSPTLR